MHCCFCCFFSLASARASEEERASAALKLSERVEGRGSVHFRLMGELRGEEEGREGEAGRRRRDFGWFLKSLFLKEYSTRKNNADSSHT